ncbi:integral membrane sensor hybrid histidine kinase [Sediminispirochaeta smaragdinae DSM 11293]|uniref:histidine kinase n=2 Tax=Sediminispirochaeta TaxID=1911556 RepID=E1RBR3_SEDSS|nr:integral membrane sensor hybrid histidine kinase [Sediminispirochaeta smaragdinae DSM 11293]
MDSLYKIERCTGEFSCRETEKAFIDLSWPVLSRRLFIAVCLSSLTYVFASCIPRPEVHPEYRTLMVPLTRMVAGLLLFTALVVRKSRGFSLFLRVLIIVAELSIGGLESADQYVYLLSIHKFYDVGTSYLVFYILIFYIVIPNKIKITVCTSIVISMMFIISVHSTGIATSSDLFTTSIYFLITNALGYAIVLNANTSKREEYHHTIQVKKAEQEARDAKLLAEEANKAKGRFLAMMNHEMCTPLNVILGGIRILENTRLAAKQKETVAIIRNSGELLTVLIQDVLDFTHIERHKLQLRNERFSLNELMREIDALYSPVAKEKGLRFSCSCNCLPVAYVKGDALRLRQVLCNLLNNAVKFTGKGSVSLHADMLERKESSALIRFEVQDTGIGIATHHIEDIVKPFVQVEDASTRAYGGSGLGLTISSELLHAMGSSLEISSKEGSGSLFGFTLPLIIDTATGMEEERLEIAEYSILLIDDTEANLKIVGGLLSLLKQHVVFARGSRQGIAQSRCGDFDVVIIDLHMPGQNGMETLREIRMTHPEIPAFLMTADTREEVVSEYRSAGFTGFIPKPVDIFQLSNALRLVGSDGQTTSATWHAAGPTIQEGDDGLEALFDEGFMDELKRDLGHKVFIDVIQSCVKALESGVDRIGNPGDCGEMADILHQLKGVAGNYRLLRVGKALDAHEVDRPASDYSRLVRSLEETVEALKRVSSVSA